MLRNLARLAAVACAFMASQALALGLGDINVKSKLNQRFSATIPVLGATPAQLDGLSVKLAGADEFNRAGIERSDYLSSLKFDIQAAPGGGRVVISSDQIAREPFLNFIVEARSPDGKLLREYTVLLDPPTLAESEAPAAAAPTPAVAAPEPAPAPPPVVAAPAPSAPAAQAPQSAAPEAQAPAVAAAPAARHGKSKGKAKAPAAAVAAAPAPEAPAAEPAAAPAPAASAAAGGATYGPTAPQETLWSIASKLRPGPQVTMDQVLLAIYRANPAAFDKGSFNGLFKGLVLQVPSLADMQSTPPAEAKDAVDAWRRGSNPVAAAAVKKNKPEPVAAEAAPVEKPKPAKPAKPAAEPKPETPAPVTVAPAATPPAKPASPPAAAPAPTPAAPPPAAASTAPPTAAPAEAAKGQEAPSATPPPASAATPAAPAAANPAPAASPSAPAAGPSAPPAKKPLAPPPPPPGLFEDTNTQIGLGVVAVLLIGAFGWFIFRRRKEPMPDFRAKAPPPKVALGPLPAKKNGAPPPLPAKPGAAAAPAEELLAPFAQAPAEPPLAATETALDDTGQFKAAETALSAAETKAKPVGGGGNLDFDLTSQFEAQTVSINMDANDPLSEADFHLAYGLYDEAAALLKQALQKEPQRQDLRTKLAETYFAAGKPVEFQETAEALHGHLGTADWQKVAIMGRQLCPDAALFKGDGEAAAAPDFDLSLGEMSLTPAPVVGHETAPPAPTATAAKGDVIDFDLDSELLKAAPATASPAPAPAANGGEKADFDLSNFDFAGEPHAPAGGDSIEFNLDELDLSKPAGGIASGDEIGTKLDLARVYADMGDNEAARGLLNEVLATGNVSQKGEAEALIKRLSA